MASAKKVFPLSMDINNLSAQIFHNFPSMCHATFHTHTHIHYIYTFKTIFEGLWVIFGTGRDSAHYRRSMDHMTRYKIFFSKAAGGKRGFRSMLCGTKVKWIRMKRFCDPVVRLN